MSKIKKIIKIIYICIIQFIIILAFPNNYTHALVEKVYSEEDAVVPSYSYSEFVRVFLDSVDKVYHMANHRWQYGDSNATPPCEDGFISCDRLVSRSLWEIGFTDQAPGGFTVKSGEPGEYLTTHGFEYCPGQYDIQPGDIIKIKGHGGHVFVVKEYDQNTRTCTQKYDCRIRCKN